MRAFVQRVLSARVEVNGEDVAVINRGLVVLVGVHRTDTAAEATFMAERILSLKLWPGEGSPTAWARSVLDQELDVLLISQFTLYGQPKANRLEFRGAMANAEAKEIFYSLVEECRRLYSAEHIKDGAFGVRRKVHISSDGPTTVLLDSAELLQ